MTACSEWHIECSACGYVGRAATSDWPKVVEEAAKHDEKCLNHVAIRCQHRENPGREMRAEKLEICSVEGEVAERKGLHWYWAVFRDDHKLGSNELKCEIVSQWFDNIKDATKLISTHYGYEDHRIHGVLRNDDE